MIAKGWYNTKDVLIKLGWDIKPRNLVNWGRVGKIKMIIHPLMGKDKYYFDYEELKNIKCVDGEEKTWLK